MTVSAYTDRISTVRLLRVLQDRELTDTDIKTIIGADEGLLEASNSFCQNCGRCCPIECTGREEKWDILNGRKVYCRVHYNEGEPEEFPIKRENPTGSKPDICRKVGPGVLYPLASCMEEKGKATPPCYSELKKAMRKYRRHLADLA